MTPRPTARRAREQTARAQDVLGGDAPAFRGELDGAVIAHLVAPPVEGHGVRADRDVPAVQSDRYRPGAPQGPLLAHDHRVGRHLADAPTLVVQDVVDFRDPVDLLGRLDRESGERVTNLLGLDSE